MHFLFHGCGPEIFCMRGCGSVTMGSGSLHSAPFVARQLHFSVGYPLVQHTLALQSLITPNASSTLISHPARTFSLKSDIRALYSDKNSSSLVKKKKFID